MKCKDSKELQPKVPVSELKYCVFTFLPNFLPPGMNRPKLMGVMLQLQSFEELFKDFQHFFPELHLQYPAQLWVTLVLSFHSQGVRSEAFSCSTIPFMPQGWGRCFCPAAACGYREHHWGRRGSWLVAWLLCLCFWTAVTSRQRAQRVTDVHIFFFLPQLVLYLGPQK